MFGTSFLEGNNAAIAVITLAFFMLLFYSIGRILQKKTKFAVHYKLLAVPIGFVTYQTVTFLLYSIFLAAGASEEMLFWVEIVKLSIFLIISISLIKDWFPSLTNFTYTRLIKNLSILGVIIGLYLVSYFSSTNIEYMNDATNPYYTYVDNIWEESSVVLTQGNEWISQFQTFDYYIYNISFITGMDSYESMLFIQEFINIAVITLSLFSLAKYRRETSTYILVPVATVALIYINGLSDVMYLPFMMLIIFNITMFYIYANSVNKNRSYIYWIISASTIFFSFNDAGIIFYLIFSTSALYLTQKEGDSPIYVLNALLISLFIQITLLAYAYNPFAGLISLIFAFIILIPLNTSIINKNSDSITEIDSVLIESRRSIGVVAIILLFIISFIVIATNSTAFTENINNFYTTNALYFTNTENDKWITIGIYLLTLGVPLFTYLYRDSNTKFTKYIVLMSIILFNPITIGAFGNLFNVSPQLGNLTLMLTIPLGLTLVDIINIYLVPRLSTIINKYG